MRKSVVILVVLCLIFTVFSASHLLAAQKKGVVIGVNVEAVDNPFFQSMVKFQENIAKELDFELVVTSADGKADKQIADIESLIARGVDGMIVAPISEPNGKKVIEICQRASTPVVIMCGWPGISPDDYRGKYYVAHAMGGSVEPGVAMGYDLANLLIDAGCRKIVAINGPHGHSPSEERYKGLMEALEEYPEVKLVKAEWGCWTREPAMKAMENLLAAYPSGEIDGVFCYNDGAAMGAIQALKNANRLKEVKVTGMDATPEAIEAIKRGELFASLGGHWMIGGFGLIVLYDYINDWKPVNKLLPMLAAMMLITEDNVYKYESQFLKKAPPFDIKSMSRTYNPDCIEDFTTKIEIH